MCCKGKIVTLGHSDEIPEDMPIMMQFCCMTRNAYELRRGIAKVCGFTQNIPPWNELSKDVQENLSTVGRAYYYDLREPESDFEKVFYIAIKVFGNRPVPTT